MEGLLGLIGAILTTTVLIVICLMYWANQVNKELCTLRNEINQLKEQNKYSKTGFDEWIENGMK
jgi:hypothetical protein